MDNITHSLTGALTAKLFDTSHDDRRTERALFWVTVLSANAPDIDVVVNLFTDQFSAIDMHRGITHSVVAAPVFAILPALLFWSFNRTQPFARFWVRAFIGVLVHILFDVITTFGTKLFLPFSQTRYALDWMFIVDPFFTATLGILLWVQRKRPARRRTWVTAAALFTVVYLTAEAGLHSSAVRAFESRLRSEGVLTERLAVFPQPFSIFRWMGAATTSTGAVRSFFSVFDAVPRDLVYFDNSTDSLTMRSASEPEAQWYYRFARIPHVTSARTDGGTVVRYQDLQFSFDRRLAEKLGMRDAPQPFVLEIRYDSLGRKEGALLKR